MHQRSHILAAGLAFLVWIALIVAMILNREFWFMWFPSVIGESIAAMGVTAWVSLQGMRRARWPSYGTMLAVPLLIALGLVLGPLILAAVRSRSLDVFDWRFWMDSKGGLATLGIPLAVFWIVGFFPAAAIVLYLNGRRESEPQGD